jgi:putative SOS response-associated peptidase YedK
MGKSPNRPAPTHHIVSLIHRAASRRVRSHAAAARSSFSVPGPHLVYGFLTTAPNAVVEPIHPKAMPVTLTTPEEYDVWMRAP